jgi:hypothetical protein
MMDVLRAEGFDDAAGFLAEIAIPGWAPSLGAAGGIATVAGPAIHGAAVLSRPLADVVRRLLSQAPELLEMTRTVDDVLSATTRVADDAGTAVARAAAAMQNVNVPPALRGNRAFLSVLEETAQMPTTSLRTWQTEPTDLFASIARGPDGRPVLKTPETPGGLTQAQLDSYNEIQARALGAHKSMDEMEGFLRAASDRAEGIPAADWYPQQQFMNWMQDAVGDDLLGRSLFSYLNREQARFSSRSNPRSQALRASWTFLLEVLGAHPAAAADLPVGFGGMSHGSQVQAVARGIESGFILDAMGQPKNTAYVRALDGNLGEPIIDVHFARSMLKDPDFLKTGDDTMDLGTYLGLRDLAIQMSDRMGMLPSVMQQRVWVGNAKWTGVGGKAAANLPIEEVARPFDMEARWAFDDVLDYIRRESGLPEGTTPADTFRAILGGDSRLQDFMRKHTAYDLIDAIPANATEDLIRAMQPEDVRTLVQSAAEEGLMRGPRDFLAAMSDPTTFRLLPADERNAGVMRLAEAMKERGRLTADQLRNVGEFLDGIKPNQFARVSQAYLSLERNAGNIMQSLRGGGFSVDFDFNRVPQLNQGIRGHIAGAYSSLQRSYPGASVNRPDRIAGMIERFFFDRMQFLTHHRHGIGGWVDSGRLVLDVSVMAKGKKPLEVGRQANQMSGFNLAAKPGRSPFVDLGGTGELPPLPSEQMGPTAIERYYRDLARRDRDAFVLSELAGAEVLAYPRDVPQR